MLENFVCSACGEELPLADSIAFDGRALCWSCRDDLTCVCKRGANGSGERMTFLCFFA